MIDSLLNKNDIQNNIEGFYHDKIRESRLRSKKSTLNLFKSQEPIIESISNKNTDSKKRAKETSNDRIAIIQMKNNFFNNVLVK